MATHSYHGHNVSEKIAETNIPADQIPAWVEDQRFLHRPSLTFGDALEIQHGGCASGAFMPAVTYHLATRTMAEHGDDVLQYMQDTYGELPKPQDYESWAGLAVFYLSAAVELWAGEMVGKAVELTEAADPVSYCAHNVDEREVCDDCNA